MKDAKLVWWGIRNAVGAALYVALVVWFMSCAGRIAGKGPELLTGIAMLMLFVASALIEATLVLGQPIWMFINGKKGEALRLFGFTAGALVLLTVLVIAVRLSVSAY